MATFDMGQASARREFKADGWTPETARRYLDACAEMDCAEGRDEFDRGFMAEVRALAERTT